MARDELRANIRETAERIKEEKDKASKYQDILINENKQLSEDILSITNNFNEKQKEVDDSKAALCFAEKHKADLELTVANNKD